MTSSQPFASLFVRLILTATLMIAPSTTLLCNNKQCELQNVNCTFAPQFCRLTADALAVVPDLASATEMCKLINMSLAAPNDSATNAQMYTICPTAGFFDLIAEVDSPCNRFVLASMRDRNASYFNWHAGEPNNLTHMPQNCSRGPVLEGCVAFAVSRSKDL
jgi:hypothetical protein